MGSGDGIGKSDLLRDGVHSGSQSSVCSVGKKRQEVHLGVTMFDGSIAGEEGQEDKVAVDVKERELMMCSKLFCEWEKGTEGRRWKGGVFYSLQEWTLHISTPTQLSRSLLQPNTLPIRSGTFMPMGHHGGIRSSRSHILLHLLLY